MGTRNLQVMLLVLFAACGGRADYDPGLTAEAGPDGGTEASDAPVDTLPTGDAQSDTGVTDVSIPDAAVDAPSTFCSGHAKLETAHGLPTEVPVSTGLVAMDCCEAFSIRFHGASSVGMDVEFVFQTYGPIPEGTLSLGASTEHSTIVRVVGEETLAPSSVVGELQIESTGPQSPWRVRLCAEVQEPGALLDGTRMFADWIPVASWGWDGRFVIKLLADTSVTATEAMNSPLDALEPGVSVLSLSHLAAYDWSEHTLVLQGLWATSEGLFGHLPTVPVHGLPFLLMVDDQRIYMGAFTTIVSSVALPLPSIPVDDPATDRITIQAAPIGGVDVREDPRVLSLMEEAGKLVP